MQRVFQGSGTFRSRIFRSDRPPNNWTINSPFRGANDTCTSRFRRRFYIEKSTVFSRPTLMSGTSPLRCRLNSALWRFSVDIDRRRAISRFSDTSLVDGFSEIFMEHQRRTHHGCRIAERHRGYYAKRISIRVKSRTVRPCTHNGSVFDRVKSLCPRGAQTGGYYGEKVYRIFRFKRDTIEPARDRCRKLCSFLRRIRVRSYCRFTA